MSSIAFTFFWFVLGFLVETIASRRRIKISLKTLLVALVLAVWALRNIDPWAQIVAEWIPATGSWGLVGMISAVAAGTLIQTTGRYRCTRITAACGLPAALLLLASIAPITHAWYARKALSQSQQVQLRTHAVFSETVDVILAGKPASERNKLMESIVLPAQCEVLGFNDTLAQQAGHDKSCSKSKSNNPDGDDIFTSEEVR